jgi:plasmid stabilization system protein ParE
MKKYLIKIDVEALSDLREITAWYELQKVDLGKRFQNAVIEQINHLAENPQIFVIRYQKIRCMPVKKFPYMIHFYINTQDSSVEVLAIISTDRNPKIWKEKTGRI